MNEKWITILGYEKLYEVSNLGRVRSIASHLIKKQSGGIGTRSRYRYVTLYRNNVGTKFTVHRLVAIAFIANPCNYPYVLHKRNNREDNSVRNLKWGTQHHNHLDAVSDGTYRLPPIMLGTNQPLSKLTPDKVRQIRKIRDSGSSFTQEALAASFGISRGTLRSILKDNHWKHVK